MAIPQDRHAAMPLRTHQMNCVPQPWVARLPAGRRYGDGGELQLLVGYHSPHEIDGSSVMTMYVLEI